MFSQTPFPIAKITISWKMKNKENSGKNILSKTEEKKTILNCSQLERSNKTGPLPVLL